MEQFCGAEPDIRYEFLTDSFEKERFHAILQHRGVGMTNFLVNYVIWRLIFGLDENILVILPNQDDGVLFQRQMSKVLSSIVGTGLIREEEFVSRLRFVEFKSNRLTIKSANKHTGRGESATLVVMHGVSKMKDADDMWRALLPSISMREGEAILTSTIDTELNFFGRIWNSAIMGDSAFIPYPI